MLVETQILPFPLMASMALERILNWLEQKAKR